MCVFGETSEDRSWVCVFGQNIRIKVAPHRAHSSHPVAVFVGCWSAESPVSRKLVVGEGKIVTLCSM